MQSIIKQTKPRKGCLQFRTRSWRAILTVTVNGESVRKVVNLNTDSKAVVRRKMARMLAEPDLAGVQTAAVAPETYAELAARVALKRQADRISDVDSEEGRERLWILPEIGQLAVERIKASHIQAIYENARQQGKSLSHLRHLRAILRSRFDVALEDEIIQSSPMARVRIPKIDVNRRERAVLTDAELVIYLGWQHPQERHRLAVLERQTMSALARCFGGLRTGDLHAMKWTDLNVPDFTEGRALRVKTKRPQTIVIPEALRPILMAWWVQTGKPMSELIFPALRGKQAGVGGKNVSHAAAMRRDLKRAFGLEAWNPTSNQFEPTPGREMTPRERELLEETELTLPVDFHSWRRSFVQAVANTGMNAQQAQKLSGHADLSAYQRYLENTATTLTIPAAALPDLTTRIVSERYDSPEPDSTIQHYFQRARQDSNLRPPDSKSDALSS